jgi:hypothetical protein
MFGHKDSGRRSCIHASLRSCNRASMVAAGHVRATEAGASGRTQVLGTKLVRRLSAAAALLAATPALATDLASPIVSGLPWRSGMSCAGAE